MISSKVLKTIEMYADDTVMYTSHSTLGVIEQPLTSEMINVSKWRDKNRLIIILNKGRTESFLFGTAKRFSSKGPMEVYLNEKLIKVADGYKYLVVWLEPKLNRNKHLRRILKGLCKAISLHLHRAEKFKNNPLKLMAHTCC